MSEYQPLYYGMNQAEFYGEKKSKEFISQLGDYTHLQERILLYGRSKRMLYLSLLLNLRFILLVILTIQLLMSDFEYTFDSQTYSLNFIKILFALILTITFLTPLAVSKIRRGCLKLKTDQIVDGLSIIRFLFTCAYIFLVISVIITSISLIILLFTNFISTLITSVIIYLLYQLFFKFINLSRSIIDDISYAFTARIHPSIFYPSSIQIRGYLIALLVLNILSWIFNFNEYNTTILDYVNLDYQVMLLSKISSILGIIILLFFITLLENFDAYLQIGKPLVLDTISPKAEIRIYPRKRDPEEEIWKLNV